MDRNTAPTRPRTSDILPEYQPRVVVKFRDGEGPFVDPDMAAAPGNPSLLVPAPMQRLSERFPQIVVERLFSSLEPEQMREMERAARSAERTGLVPPRERGTREIPDLESFYSVCVPKGTDPQDVIAAAEALAGVEEAYLQGPPTLPPVNPKDDPRSGNQGYLNAAPDGIDARYAWDLSGGDGSGVDFVDLEQGWTLDHEDLVDAGITLISGFNLDLAIEHGTAVLGIVLAQDNDRGGVGIAPRVRARVVSQYRDENFRKYSTADAIASATHVMRAGDILLLEAQTWVEGSDFVPVEADLDVWTAISIATLKGIVVVEAGGNGDTDLDTFRHPKHGFIFQRGHADYRESGAILVGAATSAHPHARSFRSNFGSRIDCYTWGEKIDTAGGEEMEDTDPTLRYATDFGQTSGASAIIAGAAVALQGIVKARGLQPWTPEHMRDALSDPGVNTPSANPATDRIGVMPNLRAIAAAESLAPAQNGVSPGSGDARIAPLEAGRAVA